MATLYLKTAGGNWSAAATWSATGAGGVDSAGPPTAADNCIAELLSGNLTIDGTSGSPSLCRSFDVTSGTGTWAGTLTAGSTAVLNIGDGTAGAGNVALKLHTGITFTGNATSLITFLSTSATVQTVDFASKTTGNVTFNAASNGSWQMTGGHTIGTTGTMLLTKGTLDVNGQTTSWGKFDSNNSNTRALTLGAADISITAGAFADDWFITGSGMTLSAASSTIRMTGNNSQFRASGGTYGTLIFTGSGTNKISDSAAQIFGTLTITGTSSKTDIFSTSSSNVTVSGTLTINSNSDTNRILVQAVTLGTARTITAATIVTQYTDWMDITAAGAANWDLTAQAIDSFGDCGGNTGITFTTAATQTWTGTGGNWATVGRWSGRVPLPQDDVSMAKAFSASQTVTANMPRLGKSIDWTGATGTPTWDLTNSANTMYGSLTLITGMAVTTGTASTFTFAGRGTHTITSATQNFTICAINAPGGSYELADSFQSVIGRNFTVNFGTFDTKNFNLTCSGFLSNSGQIRTITLGTSTINIVGTTTSTLWNFTASSGLTFSGASSTIVFSVASANTRTFAGGGLTYGKLQYTVAGSTGQLSVTGANTFKTIEFSDTTNARTLAFTAAITTNFTNLLVRGTAGKLMTITSVTAATHTLSKAASGVVDCDYLSVSQSIATGGATFFAGDNSTDGGSNTGWIFKEAPNFLSMF